MSDFRHLHQSISLVSVETFFVLKGKLMKPVGLLKGSRFSGMCRSNNSGGVSIVCYLCDFFCFGTFFVAGNCYQFCMVLLFLLTWLN